jgi:hypothetical protein
MIGDRQRAQRYQSSSRSMSSCTSSTASSDASWPMTESPGTSVPADEYSVVVALVDQPRQHVEPDREAVHDPDQLEHLKVVRR